MTDLDQKALEQLLKAMADRSKTSAWISTASAIASAASAITAMVIAFIQKKNLDIAQAKENREAERHQAEMAKEKSRKQLRIQELANEIAVLRGSEQGLDAKNAEDRDKMNELMRNVQSVPPNAPTFGMSRSDSLQEDPRARQLREYQSKNINMMATYQTAKEHIQSTIALKIKEADDLKKELGLSSQAPS